MTNGVEAGRVTLRRELHRSRYPVPIEGNEEGKTRFLILDLADNTYLRNYLRTYVEPNNTVGETSYGIVIEHHWLLPGR